MSNTNISTVATAATNRSTVTETMTPIVVTSPMKPDRPEATTLQLGIMILVLGSSAGMVFYTKRTGSMLRSVSKLSEQQLQINKVATKAKFGPATKIETEKMRPRIDKDEFF
jgi:hypothetical protein